jgi:hypothetical protein
VLLAGASDTVVVELGVPVWHPGGGRVAYEAMADRLLDANGSA